ncbi:alpha/beta hydrolase [Herbiconiux sp.]|uniref:alpha/beta fold hydrolase n=1 Tax=Herbiconiux sp. TaxID=1871186 RepID=UPI0025BDF7B8|nr:alpha/beta hydrolase [Herbiconiux sp.]
MVASAEEGNGPAVVLVPEQGEGIAQLAGLAHSIAQEDFRVVRIAAESAQHVVEVLDELGVTDAWIGGHGYGGSIAREVATAHHDRVNGVILLGVESGETVPALAEGIPVLVIQGADDDVTPPANGDALREAAPGLVSVVTIDAAGHGFPSTHAGETAWAIEDYLDWD